MYLTKLKTAFILTSLFFLPAAGESLESRGPQEPGPIVAIAAVGDIMMGTDYPSPQLPRDDGKFLFRQSKDILRKADIVFGNLEGPLCDEGFPAKKTKQGESYLFRTPTRFVQNLAEAGFNVVSLANNHAEDFGYPGLSSTKRALKGAGIKYSSKSGEVAKFKIKGLRIGLAAFSFGSPPRSIVYPEEALEEISLLSNKYDILILSIHGGKEGEAALQINDEDEYFLGEPRGNLIQFTHEAVERGADLVLVHGPHVPRAMELYHGRLIAYSLGNFCTYGGMSLNKERGYAPLLWVELGKNGEFIHGKIFSFIQVPPGAPQRDEKERALNLIKKLSQEAFPETRLFFAKSGMIFPGREANGE